MVYGLTATTPQIPQTVKIAERIRCLNPNLKLILGGPHVTLTNAAVKLEKKNNRVDRSHWAFEELEKRFDCLICGDGEEAIIEALNNNLPKLVDADDTKSPLFLSSARLTELPFPARHLIDMDSYNYTIDGEKSTSAIFQLGCPYACLIGNTLIPTELGLIKIKDLSEELVGAKEMSLNVNSENSYAKTSHILNQGLQPTKTLILRNGLTLTGHADHRIRAARNGELIWAKLSEILDADWALIQTGSNVYPKSYVELKYDGYKQHITNSGNYIALKHKLPTELNEDLAWIVGFLIGDGSISKRGLTFAIDVPLKVKLAEKFEKLFNYKLRVYPISNTDKIEQGWVYSREIRDFILNVVGVNPLEKHCVPEKIYKSPKSVVEAFLQGLWDADSYTTKKESYLVTSKEKLANEVAQLLIYIGICPSVHSYKTHKSGDGIRFHVSKSKCEDIPTFKTVYHGRNGKIGFRKTLQEGRISVSKKKLEKIEPNHPMLKKDWFYVRVKEVVDSHSEILYDLTVPGPESYISGGFVSHNCRFCSGRNSPFLRKIRTRSTENIISEMEYIYKSLGIKGLMAYDDELNVNPKMTELMNGIASLGERLGVQFKLRGFIKAEIFKDEQAKAMYRAGFRWILTGFESGSDRILLNINKKATKDENTRCLDIARNNGLKVKALMSIGHAGDSAETINETKEWLLKVKPDDFDATIITPYPGSPYYDAAIPHSKPGEYVYSCPGNNDKLYAHWLDYTKVSDYYKGAIGEYKAYVYTDYLKEEELVKLRDDLETDVRNKLGIPFNPSRAAQKYEKSMGQSGGLPGFILKTSK